MAKCFVIRGVCIGDLAALLVQVNAVGGTFVKHNTTNLNYECSFPTDAAAATFIAAAIAIDPLYADYDADPLQVLNINAGRK